MSATALTVPVLLVPSQRLRLKIYRTRRKVTLFDGITYLEYCFMPYADSFNHHKLMKNTLSLYGCYIIPRGLNNTYRKGQQAYGWLLYLHPSHINWILLNIIDDILKALTEDLNCLDPFGQKVRTFPNILSNNGHSPALSACANLMGHTTNTACSVCLIGRQKETQKGELICSSSTHSKFLSILCIEKRVYSILLKSKSRPPVRSY